MARSAYLRRQKEMGRRLFGVFPAQYPKELFWAMNAVPVEIWDPPIETANANVHLQPYICSIVKSGLALILQGKTQLLDGFLFPHTCDSIQNLASIVNDYLGLEIPCCFFYHPKAPFGKSTRNYYYNQLKSLAGVLEEHLGPLDLDELKRRVDQGLALHKGLADAYEMRRTGAIAVSNTSFYRNVRLAEYQHPDDFLSGFETFLAVSKGENLKGPTVILSGILPHPEILRLLDRQGVRVADDDLLCCGRRMPLHLGEAQDPYEILVENYFAMPPCPTRGSPIQERIGFMMDKIHRSDAQGIIFCGIKFCEPEWFDVPQMAAAAKDAGLKTLILDLEVNQPLSGQLATRIEAFAEMLR
ncbi:MAG: 2-hydroxyacyl-CoA dehydratase family protein [Deltaproteobacteria bacterium]|nr:2-hydroxyacyl-CoA dehydratase family protein [Deltaproteobacteria bacterium]